MGDLCTNQSALFRHVGHINLSTPQHEKWDILPSSRSSSPLGTLSFPLPLPLPNLPSPPSLILKHAISQDLDGSCAEERERERAKRAGFLEDVEIGRCCPVNESMCGAGSLTVARVWLQGCANHPPCPSGPCRSCRLCQPSAPLSQCNRLVTCSKFHLLASQAAGSGRNGKDRAIIVQFNRGSSPYITPEALANHFSTAFKSCFFNVSLSTKKRNAHPLHRGKLLVFCSWITPAETGHGRALLHIRKAAEQKHA
jgi:hypothetical protein